MKQDKQSITISNIEISSKLRNLIEHYYDIEIHSNYKNKDILYNNVKNDILYYIAKMVKLDILCQHTPSDISDITTNADDTTAQLIQLYKEQLAKPSLSSLSSVMLSQIPLPAQLDNPSSLEQLKEQTIQAQQLFTKLYKQEFYRVKFLINIFNLYRTTASLFFQYQIPYTNTYNNNLDTLKTDIVKVQGFQIPVRQVEQLLEDFEAYTVEYRPTQVCRFKNVSVIDGRLVSNQDTPLTNTDFVMNSPLHIPEAIPDQVRAFIDNYTTYNPEVHTEKQYHRERPFLEKELAFMAYCCLSKYTIGKHKAPFGTFFLYEDEDGTGGGKGKSEFIASLIRLLNTGGDPNSPTAQMAGSLDPKSLSTPQVQINVCSRLLNNFNERQGDYFGEDEIHTIKSMREEENTQVGKYQTQAKNTTFRGNVMISSNYVPKFKEQSNAIKERFYGIVFTLKFGKRNNSFVRRIDTSSPEFLAGLVRWAFSHNFDDPEVFSEMEDHFKEQYDLMSKQNNNVLKNFHEALNTRNHPNYSKEWYVNRNNVAFCSKNFFKTQFALSAGSLHGYSYKYGQSGSFAYGEYQFTSWQKFSDYLKAGLDNQTLKALNFEGKTKIDGSTVRRFAIDLNLLPPLEEVEVETTKVEQKYFPPATPPSSPEKPEKIEEEGGSITKQEENTIDDNTKPLKQDLSTMKIDDLPFGDIEEMMRIISEPVEQLPEGEIGNEENYTPSSLLSFDTDTNETAKALLDNYLAVIEPLSQDDPETKRAFISFIYDFMSLSKLYYETRDKPLEVVSINADKPIIRLFPKNEYNFKHFKTRVSIDTAYRTGVQTLTVEVLPHQRE